MKETKEQLLIELTKIRASHASWVEGDERRRKEFAKAFLWHKQNNGYYDKEKEPILPSWEQIFVNIGNLLAARHFLDFEGNISELECKVEDIQRSLKEANLTK